MLEETAENYKSIGKDDNYVENKCVIADTGYFSEENLTTAQEKKYRHLPGRSGTSACQLRSKCLKSEKSRWRNYQVLVASDKPDVITQMINKIDSPHGCEVYLIC
jgi:hypothetical protein